MSTYRNHCPRQSENEECRRPEQREHGYTDQNLGLVAVCGFCIPDEATDPHLIPDYGILEPLAPVSVSVPAPEIGVPITELPPTVE